MGDGPQAGSSGNPFADYARDLSSRARRQLKRPAESDDIGVGREQRSSRPSGTRTSSTEFRDDDDSVGRDAKRSRMTEQRMEANDLVEYRFEGASNTKTMRGHVMSLEEDKVDPGHREQVHGDGQDRDERGQYCVGSVVGSRLGGK